jgi:hypothetical protein
MLQRIAKALNRTLRVEMFVTNFADEIGGNVHVAVFPPQFHRDLPSVSLPSPWFCSPVA